MLPFESKDQLTSWIMERTWSEQIRLSADGEGKVKIVWTFQDDFPAAWTVWNRMGIEDCVWISLDMINTITRKGDLRFSPEKRKSLERIRDGGDKICIIVAEKGTFRLWCLRMRNMLFTGDTVRLEKMRNDGLAIEIERGDMMGLIKAIEFSVNDDGERRFKGQIKEGSDDDVLDGEVRG